MDPIVDSAAEVFCDFPRPETGATLSEKKGLSGCLHAATGMSGCPFDYEANFSKDVGCTFLWKARTPSSTAGRCDASELWTGLAGAHRGFPKGDVAHMT
jgi:hypothetical protein